MPDKLEIWQSTPDSDYVTVLETRAFDADTDPPQTWDGSDGERYEMTSYRVYRDPEDGTLVCRVIVERATTPLAADPYDESGTDTFANDPD